MLSSALLVMLGSAKFWSFYCKTCSSEIFKMLATSGHSRSFRVHQIRFQPGLRPRPRWGNLQRSPKPLSWFEGDLLLREKGGKAGREGGRRREGERRGKGTEGEATAPSNANSWIRPWFCQYSSMNSCFIASHIRDIFHQIFYVVTNHWVDHFLACEKSCSAWSLLNLVWLDIINDFRYDYLVAAWLSW